MGISRGPLQGVLGQTQEPGCFCFLGPASPPTCERLRAEGGLLKASRVGSHAPQTCDRSPGAPCPPLCSQRPRAGAAHPNTKDKTLVFARTQTSLTCSLPSPIPGPAPTPSAPGAVPSVWVTTVATTAQPQTFAVSQEQGHVGSSAAAVARRESPRGCGWRADTATWPQTPLKTSQNATLAATVD